jgi:hypothetical protein
MSRRCIVAALATAACSSLALPTVAPAAPAADTVWVSPVSPAAGQLHYGDTFSVGYKSKASQPWAYSACRPTVTTVLGTPNQGPYTYGDVMWSEYHSVYAGGPVPSPFHLIDPIQGLWLGGGATCRLDLIKFTGSNQTVSVLASTTFTVAP